eukprot:6332049-Amphidinium_carterae.1
MARVWCTIYPALFEGFIPKKAIQCCKSSEHCMSMLKQTPKCQDIRNATSPATTSNDCAKTKPLKLDLLLH